MLSDEEKKAIKNIKKEFEKNHILPDIANEDLGTLLNLVKTLIAENKELKEMLKHRIEYTNELEKDLFENCSNYVIPKSKVEEKIEEVEQWGLYNMKIPKLSTLDERLGAKIGIKYVLQSLLGKE